jgi:ABC-2 type transport system ATP-binding protein
MSDNENVVEARQLEKSYGAVKALASLDLELRSGSAVALVGRNGSGKSTLLRLLMGFFRPTSGTARVLGHEPTRLPEKIRAQIGYVADGQDLPTGMVVADYFNYLRPFYPTWDREFETKLIGLLQVPLTRKLRHLSRGQRMKAAIVGALAFHPRLLILDEPFSGLDPAVRDEVMDALFETMRSQEWTMVISSHEIEEVERLADEVIVLDDGKALVREDKDALLGNCRMVSLHSALMPAADAMPGTWWNVARGEELVTFVDGDYSEETLEESVSLHFPDARHVTVEPAPLRSIVRALLRQNN